jgi:hypothetical protein
VKLDETERKSPDIEARAWKLTNELVDLLNVRSTRAALRLFDVEFYMLARFGGLVVVHQKGRVMEEDITVILSVDKAVAFFLVEHFDCSLHETPNLPGSLSPLAGLTNRG